MFLRAGWSEANGMQRIVVTADNDDDDEDDDDGRVVLRWK